MIGQVPLEIGVRILGETPSGYPKEWGPVHMPAALDGRTDVCITAAHTSMIWLRLHLDEWAQLDDGWLGVRARLEDVNLMPFGTRPALVYDRPHDVPTVTNFHHSPSGLLFAVTMRRYS